jgi:class 3 adenylate cyclase
LATRDRSTDTNDRRELRAADRDREEAAQTLREHYTAGRLSDEEFGTRVEEAYRARTLAELETLTLDLPAPGVALPPARKTARPTEHTLTRGGRGLRTSVQIHLTIYVLVNVLLIGIWAVTGAGYFWPIWPIMGWGVGVGAHAAPLIAGVGRRREDRPSQRIAAPASVDRVAASVEVERPNLQLAAAPDGTVTILFSDIEGSTALNERLGDIRWLELLRAHHRVVRGQVQAYGGFEVKVQGDGFMVAFPGARRAVQCARAIQHAITSEFEGHPDGPIQVRIGLHTGEALKEGDDFYGKAVVLAARITDRASGGEILASSVVKELAESGGDIGFDDPRELELKGLTGTTRVFRVS